MCGATHLLTPSQHSAAQRSAGQGRAEGLLHCLGFVGWMCVQLASGHSDTAGWTPISATNHAQSVLERNPKAVAIGSGTVIAEGLKIGGGEGASAGPSTPAAGAGAAAAAVSAAASAVAPAGGISSLKRTIVGKHCKIGAGCKLSGSILMDHVTVEDG
jgi:hypothetical protein